MKYKIFILMLVLLIVPTILAADVEFSIKQSNDYDLKRGCFNNGTYCSGAAACNFTFINTDGVGSPIIDNLLMTNNGAYHNYTLNTTQTADLGLYLGTMVCTDGSLSGSDTFFIEINSGGVNSTDQRTTTLIFAIAFMLLLGILLFAAYFYIPNFPLKITSLIIGALFLLVGVNLILNMLNNVIVDDKIIRFFDVFTAMSFYIYWFAAGMLIILWILTVILSIRDKVKNVNLGKYG